MSTTQPSGATGVIGLVKQDHDEIKRMMRTVEESSGDARRDAFEDLVRKLAVHETAEEEVVHPLAKEVGAKDVADDMLREEDVAKRRLSDLDGMDVATAGFDAKFRDLMQDVLRHAEHEEQEEHPRILANEPPEKLERLSSMFELAEKTAPTRPHATAPESRAGNLALGPILAVTDRVRDAIRDARKDDGEKE